MTTHDQDPVEVYRAQKKETEKRATPHRTADRDMYQRTLSGSRIMQKVIREHKEADRTRRFMP